MNEKFTNMENEIRNFDRSIEQMMNESSVTPPYGMWNRISAQLDAEALPTPVAQAPSAAPFSAVGGYIAAAVVLGVSFLGVYMFNNGSSIKTEAAAVPTVNQEWISPSTEISSTEQKTTIAVPVEKTSEHSITRIQKTALVSSTVSKEELKQLTEIAISAKPVIVTERATPVPTEIVNSTAETADYFFPPIDININDAINSLDQKSDVAIDDERESDRKVKSGSYGSDLKFKPKKKRTKSFSYGRLNRLKNPR